MWYVCLPFGMHSLLISIRLSCWPCHLNLLFPSWKFVCFPISYWEICVNAVHSLRGSVLVFSSSSPCLLYSFPDSFRGLCFQNPHVFTANWTFHQHMNARLSPRQCSSPWNLLWPPCSRFSLLIFLCVQEPAHLPIHC